MKDIKLYRSPEVQKEFERHIQDLEEKAQGQFSDLLEGAAVPFLVKQGVQISISNEVNTPHYIMRATHPYEGTREHLVFYFGQVVESEEISPDRLELLKNRVQTDLSVLASIYAMNNMFENHVIVVKDDGTFDVPHVHLLRY